MFQCVVVSLGLFGDFWVAVLFAFFLSILVMWMSGFRDSLFRGLSSSTVGCLLWASGSHDRLG